MGYRMGRERARKKVGRAAALAAAAAMHAMASGGGKGKT
jgi:hypothetical protein